MKLAAISDMHGILYGISEKMKNIDILLIAGDTVELYSQRSNMLSKQWYEEVFIPWCQSLDCKNIVMIAGNHDFYLERNPQEFRELIKDTNIIYLENEYVTIDGVTIYGTPLCHKFFNWAFMPSDEKQKEIYMNTMDDRKIDILLSHDAPYGCSDICLEHKYEVEDPHIGSHVLRNLILEKQPTYCIHGHLHSTNHNEELLGNTKVYNVSMINEDYKMKYEPLFFEI